MQVQCQHGRMLELKHDWKIIGSLAGNSYIISCF